MNAITLSFLGGAPGGGEILLVLVVLLLFFGAKRLPGIARTLGRTLEEFRKAARDVTDEIMQGDESHADRSQDGTASDKAGDESEKRGPSDGNAG